MQILRWKDHHGYVLLPANRKCPAVDRWKPVTVKGIAVPAGDYIVLPAWDSRNNWTLRMNKQNGKDGLPPLPMSAKTPAPPVDNPISFDSTGGSCTLHWRLEKSNTLLSLEFVERNTDMPVLR